MMTAGELTQTITKIVSMPSKIHRQNGRALSAEGFKTVGGRGLSAPKMTSTDASRELTALLGSMFPKDSVSVARRHGAATLSKLSFTERFEEEWGCRYHSTNIMPPYAPSADGLAAFPSVADALTRPTLEDALVGVIDAAQSGALGEDIDRHQAEGYELAFELQLISPDRCPTCDIHCAWLGFSIRDIRHGSMDEKFRLYAGFGPIDDVFPNMKSGVVFGHRSFANIDGLLTLGEALR